MSATPRPVIAIFNSNDDLSEILRMLLNSEGFSAVSGHVNDLRHGSLDLSTFVAQHRPSLVLYDLTPPYDQQWAFLDHLRANSPLRGLPFVVMSTNAHRAQALADRDGCALRVIGRPFDIDHLLGALRETLRVPGVGVRPIPEGPRETS